MNERDVEQLEQVQISEMRCERDLNGKKETNVDVIFLKKYE